MSCSSNVMLTANSVDSRNAKNYYKRQFSKNKLLVHVPNRTKNTLSNKKIRLGVEYQTFKLT